MMNTFKRLFSLLAPKERKSFWFLLSLIFTVALLDMLGIASIMPFIAILTTPKLIETNYILNMIFEFSKIFGIENSLDFSFFLGFIVCFLLVFSLLMKGVTFFININLYISWKKLWERAYLTTI